MNADMSHSGGSLAAEITKLTPKKGDLIVVTLSEEIGAARMGDIARQLHEHFGDDLGWKTIIVPPIMQVTLETEEKS